MKIMQSVAILFLILGAAIALGAGMSLVMPQNPYFAVARQSIVVAMLFISTALNFSLIADLRKAKGLN